MPTESTLRLRPIRPEDNARVAHIIRTVMTEYGAVGEGYSIQDPEVDAMFEAYDHPRAYFLVLEKPDGEIVGCGGIAPLRGGDPDTCELKKMYFFPDARGQGMGRKLVSVLEAEARARNFRYMYLETIQAMQEANLAWQTPGIRSTIRPQVATGA
ncbi:MAG: GNAT family N-acetyltransferase [Lewinellaceae bacterium]|nr:GNAT family N-acetyltransferase [Lewinellaceae bacterium]